MKGKLIINGKEYEVEMDDNSIEELAPQPRTGYERVGHNETHYFADTMNEHMDGVDSDCDKHERMDDV